MKPLHQGMALLEARRPDGLTIRGLFEEPPSANRETPCVVIVPSFARKIRHFLPAAMHLTSNGFRAVRFDFTRHIGASDGEIFDFTPSSAVQDLPCVLDTLRSDGIQAPVGIISVSLGSRFAFRALQGRDDVAILISLVGVVNAQDTLHRVLGFDVVGRYLQSGIARDEEVFGYTVGSPFTPDLVEHDMHTLESTRRDLARCGFPIVQISAESDDWSNLADVDAAFSGMDGDGTRELYVLSAASHKLEHNPEGARVALRLAISRLTRDLKGEHLDPEDVVSPTFSQVVEKNERELSLERCGYQPPHGTEEAPLASAQDQTGSTGAGA
jgi:hypothetical protein